MNKVNERTSGVRRPLVLIIRCLCLVVAMGTEIQVQGQEVLSHPPKTASRQIPVFSARPNDSSSQCKTCAKDSESDARTDFNRMLHAPAAIPSGVRRNYRWLLPVSAITAALIVTGADERASRHVDSSSLERTSNNLSHVGLYGIGVGSAATIFALGCHHG